MDLDQGFEINPATYEWSVRLFTLVRKVLKVNVKLHGENEGIDEGDIFLFNHFARFETFIPQYLIYRETGAYCRSIAAGEFFTGDDALSNYLRDVGAIPHNHPRLLPLLAAEILRGRKVIVFPEGGMVKDRRVQDSKGDYSVYSRMADARRKHHTGAAVLAIGLDLLKKGVLQAQERGDMHCVEEWAQKLGLGGTETLLAAARRPTLIVPANITFYPIRVSENILRKGAELLKRGLSRRLSEELLIEGNILLKDTDMDIRLGEPVPPSERWSWWEQRLTASMVKRVDSPEAFFEHRTAQSQWDTRLIWFGIRRGVNRVRDEYMHRMYTGVTVNLSHLASRVILANLDRGRMEVERTVFHKTLYIAVKNVQTESSVHLHRSLKNPESYVGIVEGESPGLAQFLRTTTSMKLVETTGSIYRFLPKLLEEHEFDQIRLENLVEVYANETTPIPAVKRAVKRAIDMAFKVTKEDLSRMLFDDELIAYAWDKQYFSKPRYAKINQQENAMAIGEPFLRVPNKRKDMGVVLVHGFLASPAELRTLGERLEADGYAVLGVRLKGHGTSPWDLRERSWQDWLESVRRGYDIMSAFASRICMVGFSTGAALSLRLAAEAPRGLAGVAAVAAPLKFRNKNMVFVPLVHGANRLVRWVSSFEGIMPFRQNDSEHPNINYRNMPLRGLYELRRMVDDLQTRLEDVQCPVTVIQGTDDPVVEPQSAQLIVERLGSQDKTLTMVASNRHGILNEDVGGTQGTVLAFLDALSR